MKEEKECCEECFPNKKRNKLHCPCCKHFIPQEHTEENCEVYKKTGGHNHLTCKDPKCEWHKPQEHNQASIEDKEEWWIKSFHKQFINLVSIVIPKIEPYKLVEREQEVIDFIRKVVSQSKLQHNQELIKEIEKYETIISDLKENGHCDEPNCPECQTALLYKTLVEILAKLHTMPIEEHRCRFNDGNQSCNCYKEGLRDCRRIIKEYILKDNERTHL